MKQNRITLVFFLALLFILLWANLKMVAPYMLAVVMGGLLSIVTKQIHRWLRERKVGTKLAAGIVTAGVVVMILAPIGFFTLLAVSQGIETAQYLSQQPGISLENISQKLTKVKAIQSVVGDAHAVQEQFKEGLKRIATLAPSVVFKFFGGLPEFVLQLLLALLSCYFLLVDGGRFLIWLRDKLPLDPEARSAIFKSFHETAISSIVATVTAASVQSAIMLAGFLILGVPTAFLAAGLTFVLAWVPIVGSTPVWLGGAAYLFAQGATGKAIVMIGFGVLTGISDNLVHPLVLKGRGQMHPLVSLVAIFGGIHLFGIFGVFIGPILAALLVSALKVWPVIAERYGILKASHIITTPSTSDVSAPAHSSILLTQEPA